MSCCAACRQAACSAFGVEGRGFGGDSLSHGARRGEVDRQVGHNGVWAHVAVARREALERVGSTDRAELLADPAHERIDYSFSLNHFPFNAEIKLIPRKILRTLKNYWNFTGGRLQYLAQLLC
jgi:hypothetical protein